MGRKRADHRIAPSFSEEIYGGITKASSTEFALWDRNICGSKLPASEKDERDDSHSEPRASWKISYERSKCLGELLKESMCSATGATVGLKTHLVGPLQTRRYEGLKNCQHHFEGYVKYMIR